MQIQEEREFNSGVEDDSGESTDDRTTPRPKYIKHCHAVPFELSRE